MVPRHTVVASYGGKVLPGHPVAHILTSPRALRQITPNGRAYVK